ncbi:hypothetical protein TJA_24740 [Thermus sp. LT1-2-5]|uniref:CAP domain-containing protein n=1 Tax=Thermus sp. LT1-2-5 TaxID=3026935 RepID=UPI0030EA4D7C
MVRKETLLIALLALALAGLLSACNTLFSPPKPNPVALSAPTDASVPVDPGGSHTLTLTLQDTAKRVEVRVALADPCAKSTANCPGWDASRYPGVTHPTGTYTLDGANPRVDLLFQVAADALPQGPYKYEIQVRDAEGNEWVAPFYLKIRDPRGRPALEALADWRQRAGLPGVREDLEWSWRGWLHSRYAIQNYPDNLPHDEDLSQPFATLEGKEAARGNEWGFLYRWNGQPRFPPEEQSVNWWITAPFHRFPLVYPWEMTLGHGIYRDVGPIPGSGDGYGRSYANLPNLSPWTSDRPIRDVLFPTPGMRVPLNRYAGRENPNPTYPCTNPSAPPRRPYLTQEGLTWDDGAGRVVTPIGFPVTVMTFAQRDTEVLEARLKRLSDGQANPVCAYGSLQYWEDREFWRNRGIAGLKGYGAVVVLPHQPLTPGYAYEVYIRARVGDQERSWTWQFQVDREMVPLNEP